MFQRTLRSSSVRMIDIGVGVSVIVGVNVGIGAAAGGFVVDCRDCGVS